MNAYQTLKLIEEFLKVCVRRSVICERTTANTGEFVRLAESGEDQYEES